MFNWSFAASTTVVLAGLLIWAGAAWLCHANWTRGGRRRSTAWLEGLRFVLITLLVFTLLRPEFVQLISRSENPEIAVLIDSSASMNTRDVFVTNTVVSRAEWLQVQRHAAFWKPLEQSGRVLLEEFSTPPADPNVEAATDLNDALESALRRHGNLKAVLVLSDGDWNTGKSPIVAATRLREQDVPVFAVGVGQEASLPDLILESVFAPSYGLFGEQISIPFKIRSHLPREVETTITLLDPKGEEVQKLIRIPALGEMQDAVLWSPRFVGENHLALELQVQPDEALPENNRQEFRINIRVETLKVLVVDSLPRWEYRFLRNALERDPGVEMHCILFHPGMEPGGGRGYLPEFPGTKDQLSRYDVIFLGDVGIGENELTARDVELVRGLVEQQSSGLILLPGRRGRQMTFLESALKDLMPVILDESRPGGVGLQSEASLTLSSLGKRHWLTRFDANEHDNDELWKLLPGFFWSAAVEKSRPGSEVLAVHSALRNSWGRMPLIVTRPASSGKVLFMGSDSAWRWRRGVEDKFHYRFWSQVVRWMAHQRHLAGKEGIRLSYSPESPLVGDTIFMQTTVLDAAGLPIESGPVFGKLTSPGGRSERVEFAMLEGGWGVFKSSFTPQESGKYKIEITAEQHGRELETGLLITQPQREKLGQPVNSEILREIAGITRGAYVPAENFADVLKQISLLPEPKPLEKRIRLWSEPLWGAFLLLLMAVYWVGRKLAGLV